MLRAATLEATFMHRFLWALLLVMLAPISHGAPLGNGFAGLRPGCDGSIYDMLRMPNGDLIVAGSFSVCGDAPVSNIARFDGARWHALGQPGAGVNGPAYALALYRGEIHVAGSFSLAARVPANAIARFDGERWHALAQGLYYEAYSLAVFNDELYAGGLFLTSAGQLTNGLVRWNGRAWRDPTNLGNPSMFPAIRTLHVHKNALYASSDEGFQIAGRNVAIASLTAQGWRSLPFDLLQDSIQFVADFVSIGDTLYAVQNSLTCSIICRGRLLAITDTGKTVVGRYHGYAASLEVFNNTLHVGGTLSPESINGYLPPVHLVRLVGPNAWKPLIQPQMPATIWKLLADSNGMLVAGNFSSLQNVDVSSVARYENGLVQPLGSPNVAPWDRSAVASQ